MPARCQELLKNGDRYVRAAARGALGAMGEATHAYAGVVSELLKSGRTACEALGRMGEEEPRWFPTPVFSTSSVQPTPPESDKT
jgi:hypothetical protein